jgi:DNA invertase Pin-like site-specific DNA recombinase
MIVGYARTSTWDQTAGLAAQQRDLKAAGAEKVFSEQASSVAQRTKLNECLAFLRDGDALTVTKPDRLARSTTELLAIEADLSKRGVGLVVLSMGGERLDTRNPTSKLMLTILAGVATWEREIMLERQREGIAKAKAAGKYKGRPVSIDAAQIRRLRAELGPAAPDTDALHSRYGSTTLTTRMRYGSGPWTGPSRRHPRPYRQHRQRLAVVARHPHHTAAPAAALLVRHHFEPAAGQRAVVDAGRHVHVMQPAPRR